MAENSRGSKEPPVAARSNSGRTTGILLLAAAAGTVAYNLIGRLGLGISEDSAAVSFSAYERHPLPIFVTYGGGILVGLLFVATAALLYLRFDRTGYPWLRVAATCQALAGLLLALSASRWLVVLPFLKQQYDSPSASAASRAAIEVDYQTISYYLGITLGEQLFAILTGVWTLILAICFLRLSDKRLWLGWLGVIAGSAWLLGSLEPLDFNAAGFFIVFLAGGPLLWLAWTVLLTVNWIRGTRRAANSRAT